MEGLWAFPPNKEFGGTIAWWVGCHPEPVLIDCPEFSPESIEIIETLSKGLKGRILLTSREGHGQVRSFQESLGWPVLLQEQEAYLLPGVSSLESFSNEFITSSGIGLLWTPGPTPGSSVVYAQEPWNVLFCGRLLLPVSADRLAPAPSRKTFHKPLQLKSLEKLRAWLPPNSFPQLASSVAPPNHAGGRLLGWDCWK